MAFLENINFKMSSNIANLTTVHCASHAPCNFPICQHRVPPLWVGLPYFSLHNGANTFTKLHLNQIQKENWFYRKEVSIAEIFLSIEPISSQIVDLFFMNSWKILHSLAKFWLEKLKKTHKWIIHNQKKINQQLF